MAHGGTATPDELPAEASKRENTSGFYPRAAIEERLRLNSPQVNRRFVWRARQDLNL